MTSGRAFYALKPKTAAGWLLAGASLCLFLAFVTPKVDFRAIIISSALAGLILVFKFLPDQAVDRWEELSAKLRGFLAGTVVYAAVVTAGYLDQLRSIRLWADFLTLQDAAPFSAVHITALVAAACAYSTQRYAPWPASPTATTERVTEGQLLIGFEQAKRELQSLVSPDKQKEPKLFWGGIERPISTGNQRFGIVGAPDSGKSKTFLLAMRSVLPHVTPGSNRRALVYDVKRDIYGTLIALGIPKDRLALLNCFDLRSRRWNMAADITDPETAVEIGTILVPDKGDTQPFFPEAARAILGAVMEAFHRTAAGKWRLRDVVLTIQSEARLKVILREAEQTRYLVEKYVTGNDTYKSIASTLENVMRRLSFIAAAWEHAQETFSVAEWMRSEQIVLLGSLPKLDSTVQQLNAALMHRISQELLTADEADTHTPSSQTWIFIDEFRQAGKISEFGKLMVGGRSKGACIVIGFQDFPGLVDVYGLEVAREIFGACGNKAFLKIEELETAKIATEYLGKQTVEITRFNPSWTRTVTSSPTGTSVAHAEGVSVSRELRERPTVSVKDLMSMDLPNPIRGLHGYYRDHSLEHPYDATIPGSLIAELPKPSLLCPNFVERPTEHSTLHDWDEKDLERLNLLQHAKALLTPVDQTKTARQGILASLSR